MPALAADEAHVLQDGTPIVSKPGVGGRILALVDAGFPLTVIGRRGEWLEVSTSLPGAAAGGQWVPAARVGEHMTGRPSAVVGMSVLRLEVVGTRQLRVRAKCRILRPGKDDLIEVTSEVPARIDLPGATADCTVRKLGGAGTIEAVLLTAEGSLIAAANTSTRRGGLRVRTSGPWGSAAGFSLPTGVVLLKDPFALSLPPDNPVPPLGSPVPALGNPTPPFQQSPVPTP